MSRRCRAQRPPPPSGPVLLTRSCPLVHVRTGPRPAPLGAQALPSPLPFPGLASLNVCAPPILLVVAHHHPSPRQNTSRSVTLSPSSEAVLRGPRRTGRHLSHWLLGLCLCPPPCCSASAAFSSYSCEILGELVLRSHPPESGWCPGAAGSGGGGGSGFQSGMGGTDPAVKVQMMREDALT